ncbi:hypothetical protein SC984_05510 [Legionella pneumophila serogroup 1]|uniref:hypothetical protein n=1 Tax=Legionella pneumophila TaxID=446 RepID=UPI0005C9C30C|nr:hypothetical protein [Legionella pneumophila]WAI79311.1 hypothetical protein OXA86_00380 [Legionella pneumophila]
MNSKKPVHFSDHFNIDKAKLNELGVFDPILNFDTKVFVEPLLLKDSASEIIRNSYQNYKTFFAHLLLLLQKSTYVGDKCWRTAKRMVNFPEYQFTCIGYSSGNTEGRGSGIEFNDKILQSAKEIVDLAEGNPEIFLLLPLLEDGIAGDRISDMVQNIIDDDICRYTQEIMAKLDLKGNRLHTSRNCNPYKLLFNPYSKQAIKLVPFDILSNLPVADNVDAIVEELAAYNERLRDIVNRDIGDIWLETTKAYRKEILLKELKTNKEFFVETLTALKAYSPQHYDFEKDYEGLYKWLKDSQKFINVELSKEAKDCPDDLESLMLAVTGIVHHYRDTIENKEMWRTFWTLHNSEYKHVKSHYSYMLFFTVCRAWLVSQNSNISINFKQRDGQPTLEFTTSGKNRLSLHIKHANNTSLAKGYKNVLEKYRHVKNEKHCYLIMNFKAAPAIQLKEIRVIQNPICEIFEIDVTKRNDEQTDEIFKLLEPEFEFNLLEFEDMVFEDSLYTGEKRKGGKNSYLRHKTLKEQVQILCREELNKKKYPSALQLCQTVANRIINELPELLDSFEPYNNYDVEGRDWTKPTFYRWCNSEYKSSKDKLKSTIDLINN